MLAIFTYGFSGDENQIELHTLSNYSVGRSHCLIVSEGDLSTLKEWRNSPYLETIRCY